MKTILGLAAIIFLCAPTTLIAKPIKHEIEFRGVFACSSHKGLISLFDTEPIKWCYTIELYQKDFYENLTLETTWPEICTRNPEEHRELILFLDGDTRWNTFFWWHFQVVHNCSKRRLRTIYERNYFDISKVITEDNTRMIIKFEAELYGKHNHLPETGSAFYEYINQK